MYHWKGTGGQPYACPGAIRQLELEGLVTSIPNKGTYVNGISREDVQDIYMIRSRLEGLAARLATRRITKEQIERWKR